MIQRVLNRWAEISKRYYAVIILVAVVVGAVSFVSASETEISTKYFGFFYPETNYMEEIRFIQSEFPGTQTAQILIAVDRINARSVLEPDLLEMTADLVEAVSDVAGVKSVESVLDLGGTKNEILSRPSEQRSPFVDEKLRHSLVTVKLAATEIP